MSKYKLEYIWFDGYQFMQSLCSKIFVWEDFSGNLEDVLDWNFDGFFIEQVFGDGSDMLFKLVVVFLDLDCFGGNGWLVMNEVFNVDCILYEFNGCAII